MYVADTSDPVTPSGSRRSRERRPYRSSRCTKPLSHPPPLLSRRSASMCNRWSETVMLTSFSMSTPETCARRPGRRCPVLVDPDQLTTARLPFEQRRQPKRLEQPKVQQVGPTPNTRSSRSETPGARPRSAHAATTQAQQLTSRTPRPPPARHAPPALRSYRPAARSDCPEANAPCRLVWLSISASLGQAGDLVGIDVLDHMVIGHDRWVSLARRGALTQYRDDRSEAITLGRALER